MSLRFHKVMMNEFKISQVVVVACSLCWEGWESWEKLCGQLCVGENIFVVEGAPKRWVSKDILEFYGESLLKCSIPILFCPTSKGKSD